MLSETYKILVFQPGIELMPMALKAWSPNYWTAREVPKMSKGFEWIFH